jgi:hypothetical protein
MGYTKAPPYDHDHENEVQLFAETNHRNRPVTFGIKTDDRRRHVYVIGKSGMGKSCLLENMFLSDIHAGHGCCYIDPHGDTADRFLDYIPPNRINDVVYFNPADVNFPIGFNILEAVDQDKKHLVASGLMSVFKKIWPDVWSARMEYILINTILALLDVPGATLLGINRLYVDEDYRQHVVSLIQDPVVKTFWVKEFASFTEKYRTEAVAPVQNKVGQFMSSSIIRNVVAQTKSTIDMREIMDSRKILIINLSKGLIGEENMRLLGNMMITRLQLAAMERVDMPEKERQDFFLYIDEFQNFATESFASILSEARKYRLALIVAHQYIEQLEEEVRHAVFGNVGTMITFRVGGPDAVELEKEFAPTFVQEDLIGLTKYNVYMRLLIDGVASQPFSAKTLPPISSRFNTREQVVHVSRERYAVSKVEIEGKVLKWSGFGTADVGGTIATEEEITVEDEKIEERVKELQASSPYVGEMAKSADGGGFGGKKKSDKPTFDVPCSVCNEIQKLTFEPDWSKPWFCKNHLEMRNTPAARRLPTLSQLTGRNPGAGKPEGSPEERPREVVVVLPRPVAVTLPPRPEPERIVVLPRPKSPEPERIVVLPKSESAVPTPEKAEERVASPKLATTGEGEIASHPVSERPRPERRPPPPPLATGKPRIVISTGGDFLSDAEELRAAVTKPSREKEKEDKPEEPTAPQEAPPREIIREKRPPPPARSPQDRPTDQRHGERREVPRQGPPPLGQGKVRLVAETPVNTPEKPSAPVECVVVKAEPQRQASPVAAPVVNRPTVIRAAPEPVSKSAPTPAPKTAPAPAPSPAPTPTPTPALTPAPKPSAPPVPPPKPATGWKPGQVIKF